MKSDFQPCGWNAAHTQKRYRPECLDCTHKRFREKWNYHYKKQKIKARIKAGKTLCYIGGQNKRPNKKQYDQFNRRLFPKPTKITAINYKQWWITFIAFYQNPTKSQQEWDASVFREQFWYRLRGERDNQHFIKHATQVPSPKVGIALYNKIYRFLHKVQINKADRIYRKANPEKEKRWKKIWMARNPDKVRAIKKRRELRKRGYPDVKYEPVIPKEIAMRDGWKCAHCHKRIPKDKKVPHPEALTMDHIIPLNCGGTHEPKNVQASHFMCNSIKQDNVGYDQLRIF